MKKCVFQKKTSIKTDFNLIIEQEHNPFLKMIIDYLTFNQIMV